MPWNSEWSADRCVSGDSKLTLFGGRDREFSDLWHSTSQIKGEDKRWVNQIAVPKGTL